MRGDIAWAAFWLGCGLAAFGFFIGCGLELFAKEWRKK